ncbi:hypothetical protein VTK56DRAFT_4000 [Thermocarpiscus australiensis]
MSVFSMIKKGRQAAKEHRAVQAEKEKKEAEKPPYRHIPKHAAIDALSGGPAGWREHDRRRIVEQNRRRSAMTASGLGMSGVMTPVHMGIPRVHSSLSHVSYPSGYASPIVQLPRNYSYSSMTPGWTHQGGETSYSPMDMGGMSLKGKEVERVIVDSSPTSQSSSRMSTGRFALAPGHPVTNGDVAASPVDSSSNSTSSQDDLEMKPVRHSASVPPSASATRPNGPTSNTETIHRLHPARHSRRVSDPNQSVAPARSSLAPRTTSLAPGIPPVPALPPLEFGTALTTPVVSSPPTSSASSVTMVPVASSTSLAAQPAAPIAIPMAPRTTEAEKVQHVSITTEPSSEEEVAWARTPARARTGAPDIATIPDFSTVSAAPAAMAGSTVKNRRRISKVTRFTELETIKPNTSVTIESTTPSPQETSEERRRPTATALPTTFDESALPAPQAVALPPPRTGKLSKSANSGAKLVKKNRWSLRSGKSAAVAG